MISVVGASLAAPLGGLNPPLQEAVRICASIIPPDVIGAPARRESRRTERYFLAFVKLPPQADDFPQ